MNRKEALEIKIMEVVYGLAVFVGVGFVVDCFMSSGSGGGTFSIGGE
ncbi:MAG: hypothetical protein ABR497_09040 [Kiritimatiellia bacterium]|nr:hypothetical protein [Lentisphaerota bacterium]